jgi:hypothetical protein
VVGSALGRRTGALKGRGRTSCKFKAVAATDQRIAELILQNLLLGSEHRTWLKNIRLHFFQLNPE